MKKKRGFRGIQTLICLLLAVLLFSAELTPALAVTQKEIDNLKDSAGDLQEEIVVF